MKNFWMVIALLFVAFICLGVGLYFLLFAESDDGQKLLRPLKPDIQNEQILRNNLQIIHPELSQEKHSRYQLYVTPDAPAVIMLADQIDGVMVAYQEAVGWTWVSDQTLHGQSEKWLKPEEFLSDTPTYGANPVKPEVVSDCEEQANTLVSLLRAEGVAPGEVRVVIGEVDFGGEVGGHAWVQLWYEGEWIDLDATSGPYWDDDQNRLVDRNGYPFRFYANHDYPVVQVWAYYNDVFYWDPRTEEGNAPESWKLKPLLQQA
jgi:hypothetical protein